MKEIWKDVVGYQGLYKVSNLGNVKSCYTGKLLKYRLYGSYLQVILWDFKKTCGFAIHRLVAQAFIKKTQEDVMLNRNFVNHIDGNKQNNCVNNLRWCTAKEKSNFPIAIENRRLSIKNRKRYYHFNIEFYFKNILTHNIYYEEIIQFIENYYNIELKLKSRMAGNYIRKYDERIKTVFYTRVNMNKFKKYSDFIEDLDDLLYMKYLFNKDEYPFMYDIVYNNESLFYNNLKKNCKNLNDEKIQNIFSHFKMDNNI